MSEQAEEEARRRAARETEESLASSESAVALGEGEEPCDDFLHPDLDVAGPASLARLTPFHRKILSRAFECSSFSEVAREVGCSSSYVRNLVKGHQAPWFRQAFKWLLYEAGLHPAQVVAGMVEATQAVEHKWNHETKSWDQFPDYRTRLKANETLAKLLELDPPKEKGGAATAALQVNIQTNLGNGTPVERPGHFTVAVGERGGDGGE